MNADFVEVSTSRFYLDVWPGIANDVEAIQSNLDACVERGERPLVVHWGYKSPEGEKVVLAISCSDGTGADRHWVAPDLAAMLSAP